MPAETIGHASAGHLAVLAYATTRSFNAREVEDRRREIGPVHAGVADHAAFLLGGMTHDQRQVDARLVRGGLRTGKRRTVVAERENQRVVHVARVGSGL